MNKTVDDVVADVVVLVDFCPGDFVHADDNEVMSLKKKDVVSLLGNINLECCSADDKGLILSALELFEELLKLPIKMF